MPDLRGTIFGEMTLPGRCALRAVRVSGELARKATSALFAASSDPWSSPRKLINGKLTGRPGGPPIDDVLVAAFPGPDSYTGEDVAEFHCHGSEGVLRALFDSLLGLGIRRAAGGEFSYRAFLNGKLDRGGAASLRNLVSSQTALEAAASIGSGERAEKELGGLRDDLVAMAALWEGRLDFPEDVPQKPVRGWSRELAPARRKAAAVVAALLRSRALREGFRVAIFGAPNSGKSSLFNNLLGTDRAIVAPHPGTTRDIIEEKVDVAGFPVVFQDMAGAREKSGRTERSGIERAVRAAQKADCVLFLFDGSRGWGRSDEKALGMLEGRKVLPVATKKDLRGGKGSAFPPGTLEISNVTLEGLPALLGKVGKLAGAGLPKSGDALLLSEAQASAAARSASLLEEAEECLLGNDEVAAAEALKRAVRELDLALSKVSDEEIYDVLFRDLCIGK